MTDVTHKNILAVMQHSKNNKAEIDSLSGLVTQLQAEKLILNQRLEMMMQQIQQLQVTLYSGGSTSGNIN